MIKQENIQYVAIERLLFLRFVKFSLSRPRAKLVQHKLSNWNYVGVELKDVSNGVESEFMNMILNTRPIRTKLTRI